MTERFTGTCKWFNEKKGFGFIVPDQAGKDVFVHISALVPLGLKTLRENQRVAYELRENRGKLAASNLQVLS